MDYSSVGIASFSSHLGFKGSSLGAARGGAGGLPVGGGFSGSSNNLESGQGASVEAGLRLPDLPGGQRRKMIWSCQELPSVLRVILSITLAHLCSWLPRDTEGTLLLAPVSSLSMLIHSGKTQRRET